MASLFIMLVIPCLVSCSDSPLDIEDNQEQVEQDEFDNIVEELPEQIYKRDSVLVCNPLTLKLSSKSATTASFTCSISEGDEEIKKMILNCAGGSVNKNVEVEPQDEIFEVVVDSLTFNSVYRVSFTLEIYNTVSDSTYVRKSEVLNFETAFVRPNICLKNTDGTVLSFAGQLLGYAENDCELEVGMCLLDSLYYPKNLDDVTRCVAKFSNYNEVEIEVLKQTGTDFYCSYVLQNDKFEYGPIEAFAYAEAVREINMTDAVDLSANGTANCYVIPSSGTYKLKTVKGNSAESVGDVKYPQIIWESLGTVEMPKLCSLISSIFWSDGYLYFSVPSNYMEGNALIAVKDVDGNILWSWHLWLVPEIDTYNFPNDLGISMSCNLGVVNGQYGLLYQWGRKDPFMGATLDKKKEKKQAKSSCYWKSVSTDRVVGVISYAVANPTTFIGQGETNDWQYAKHDSRWSSVKTIYDPCPVGWKIPDTLFDNVSVDEFIYNENKEFVGCEVGGLLYPAAGYLSSYSDSMGQLYGVGRSGCYWTTQSSVGLSAHLHFNDESNVLPRDYVCRSNAYSVRCVKE